MTAAEADDTLRDLRRALLRLEAGQGDRARRNARSEVLGELAGLRDGLADAYPPPKRRTQLRLTRRGKVTVLQRRRDALTEQNTDPLGVGSAVVVALASAGVHPRREAGMPWLPNWAIEMHRAGETIASIARARTSQKHRQLRLTEIRLGKGTP